MKLKPILISWEQYTDDPVKIVLVDAEAEIEEGSVVYFGTYVIEILRISIPNDSVTFMKPADDKLLTLPGIKRFKLAIASTTSSHNLPLLSAKATSILIDYYNEHKCMPEFVEVIEIIAYHDDQMGNKTVLGIQLNQEGTINITIPEEVILYTEAEVKQLVNDALHSNDIFISRFQDDTIDSVDPTSFNKWFNEHKK